jgi:uncharacterized protein YggE
VLFTLGVLLVVFLAVKIVGEVKTVSHIGKVPGATNSITVSGKGEILATPDIATFSFSVTEEAPAVPDAQKNASEKTKAILAYLKKKGVDDKDVKTLSYNIYPRYEYTGATYYNSGKQILAAYVVSQTVEVKVRALEDAGSLLSGIGEFGATNISGLSFSVDKQDEVSREARDKAIQDAREQAEVLAKSLDVKLGDIISFSENPYYPGPIYYAKDMAMGMGGGGEQTAPQLPSGESKIVSNVTITYEIR